MRVKLVTAVLLCTIGAASSGYAAEDPAAVGQRFLTAFRDCQARHDAAACSALLADDAMVYSDKGEAANAGQFLRDLTPHAKADEIVRQFTAPEDIKAWRVGDLLFFNYRSVWSEMYGTQPYRIEFRGTLVLSDSATGPKLRLFQATSIPNTQRQPSKTDPAAFDQYVGEYSAGPGDHEVITREGDQLLMTINGGRVRLLPGNANTFYIRGESDDWEFERDAQGRVTGLESRWWGQNILAKRLP
jgi:hypothetical protein